MKLLNTLALAAALAALPAAATTPVPATPPPPAGHADAARASAAAGAASATDEAPARTPRFLLRAPNGRGVTAEDFRGRLLIVTFGFTSCPDVCPTTMVELQQLLRALGPRAEQVRAIFISVDPERDTPAVVNAYTAAFDERIVGLTGTPALVRHAADSFGVVYRKVPLPAAANAGASAPGAAAGGVYTVDHSAGLYLVGPEGLALGRIGYGTPAAEITRRVGALLDEAFGAR